MHLPASISLKFHQYDVPIYQFQHVPSGKLTFYYGKSPCLMGKSTISMAIFNSYFDISRGYPISIHFSTYLYRHPRSVPGCWAAGTSMSFNSSGGGWKPAKKALHFFPERIFPTWKTTDQWKTHEKTKKKWLKMMVSWKMMVHHDKPVNQWKTTQDAWIDTHVSHWQSATANDMALLVQKYRRLRTNQL